MSHMCYICNKPYANKASLAAHKSRYHKTRDNNSNETHQSFGNDIPKFGENPNNDNLSESSENIEDNTKMKKRSHSSEESDTDNEVIVKRTKTKESNDEIVSKLVRVVAKLIKEMKQVHSAFGEVAKDIDKVEDQVDENKRNISSEIVFKQMDGSGLHMEMKRFYQKIMDENPNLIKDIKETKKSVDALQEHSFFKDYLKETNKVKKNIMIMEECFINAMEIRKLFNGDIEEINFKVKELQNAAQVANRILELSQIESLMLKAIMYSSKIQVMDLLDEWFIYLRLIFDRLPSDEDLKKKAKELTQEYKLIKEEKIENELGEDVDDQTSETSESDSEDADDEASEKSESDNGDNHVNEESVNGTEDNSKTIYEGDEDSQTENDDKSVTSKDESETHNEDIINVGDEVSDISKK